MPAANRFDPSASLRFATGLGALLATAGGCDPSITEYDCSRVALHVGTVQNAERSVGTTPSRVPILYADCAYRVSSAAFACIEKAESTAGMARCVREHPYKDAFHPEPVWPADGS